MKKIFVVIGVSMVFTGVASASEDLAKAKNCMTCHSVAKKIVGPAYKDIAAKRAGEKGADAALAAKIKSGSKDEWGKVPMPANDVSDADAMTLAKWILTLK